MTAVRSFLFNIWFYGTLTIFLLTVWVVLPLPWRVLTAAIRSWARVALWGLKVIVGLDWEVRGRENLPDGAVIIAAKHQSAWDTLAPLLIFPDAAWVMKIELSRIPLWGLCAIRAQAIFVDRKAGLSALKKLAADARQRLADGLSVIIFPEGTRTQPGHPPDYAPGIAALYTQSNVPVVPVALNSGLYWGRRSFVKRSGTIVLEILPAIPPGLDRKTFMKTLQERIETATEKLICEGETAPRP